MSSAVAGPNPRSPTTKPEFPKFYALAASYWEHAACEPAFARRDWGRLKRGGKQQKRRLAKSLRRHDCRDRHNSIGDGYAESVHNSGDINDYRQLCAKHGVNDNTDQTVLIRFLHDLGNILNFDDPDSPYHLADTKVLNPEWVTAGVYRIVNSSLIVQQDGVLYKGQISSILDDSRRYPEGRAQFILDMMRQFELCFSFPDPVNDRYLIPELLRPNEPDLNWDASDALNFQYHYKVLPKGIMPRFIVRMHRNLTMKPTYWQSGVVLGIEGCSALVRGDVEGCRIYVSVSGSTPARRRSALAVIRQTFRQIHSTIPGIGAEEKVPLPNSSNVVVGYKHLTTLEDQKIKSFVPEGSTDSYKVSDLLGGIEDIKHRGADRYGLDGMADLNRESLDVRSLGKVLGIVISGFVSVVGVIGTVSYLLGGELTTITLTGSLVVIIVGSSGFLVDVRSTPAPLCSFCGTGIDHCALA